VNVDLTFDSKGQGQVGNYEAFIELSQNDTITIHPPADWTIQGARLFTGVNGKATAAAGLRGQNPNWQQTFQNNPGFGSDTLSWSVQADGTGLITDNLPANNASEYDFLVWIQKPNPGGQPLNDFLDPGIRNR
jgi:hypothetical protein